MKMGMGEKEGEEEGGRGRGMVFEVEEKVNNSGGFEEYVPKGMKEEERAGGSEG